MTLSVIRRPNQRNRHPEPGEGSIGAHAGGNADGFAALRMTGFEWFGGYDYTLLSSEAPRRQTRKIAPSFLPSRMVMPAMVMPRNAMAQTPSAEAMNLPSPSSWKSS
jgi:hypothetical protein